MFLSNVYVLVTLVSPAKTFEPIEMLSGPYLCGPGLDRGHIDTPCEYGGSFCALAAMQSVTVITAATCYRYKTDV